MPGGMPGGGMPGNKIPFGGTGADVRNNGGLPKGGGGPHTTDTTTKVADMQATPAPCRSAPAARSLQ